MKITNRKDKNMNVMKITCNENHDENHQQRKKHTHTTMIRTTSYNKYHDEDHQQKRKDHDNDHQQRRKNHNGINNSTTMKIPQHVMNTYNYNDHDHQSRYLKSKTLREKECVNGKLNFRSQTKLLPQHYQIGTMMRLCFLFVRGHCSQTSQEVKT